MIQHSIHISELDRMSLIVTVHARVVQKDIFLNTVAVDRPAAEKWLSKSYRDIYAEALLNYINQRHAAYQHFKVRSLAFEQSIQLLAMRFERVKLINLQELIRRVIASETDLINIQPSESSRFHAWRETIQSLIKQCHEFNENIQRDQRSRQSQAHSGLSKPKYPTFHTTT